MERKWYIFPKKSNFHSWVIDVMVKIISMFSPKILVKTVIVKPIALGTWLHSIKATLGPSCYAQ
jgi:hypothetical protein